MASVELFIKYFFLMVCLCYSSFEAKNSEAEFGNTVIVEGHHQLSLIKSEAFSSEFGTKNVSNADCNCGKFSRGCEIQNGLKICSCNAGYAQGGYQMCVPMCNETSKCNNGGSCYNNVCICKPGTSGPFCDVIAGCSELQCEKDTTATCSYDVNKLKPYCQCKTKNYQFDYDAKICKSCKCDNCTEGLCFYVAKKCEFIRGEKTCTCVKPLNQYNPKTQICEPCNCGSMAQPCEFGLEGNKKCKCGFGYAMNYGNCEKCLCSFGQCKFENFQKKCICPSGFSEFNGNCKSCDCGDAGTCEFDGFGKTVKCNCKDGYKEYYGICIDEQLCYCGENSNCSYFQKKKTCECQPGFQEENGLCLDINECQNSTICPSHKKCINTQGSYECVCKDGYRISSLDDLLICEDINECLNSSSCPGSDTICLNTEGSYRCVCKEGYLSRGGEVTRITCENKSSWKLGYGFFIGIFAVIILGMMFLIYRKCR